MHSFSSGHLWQSCPSGVRISVNKPSARASSFHWEEFAKELLWDNIVFRKNDDSGYEQGDETGNIGHYRYMSVIGETFHTVTSMLSLLNIMLFYCYG